MENDERVIAGLNQLHEDITELTSVIRKNYEGVVSQNASMKRIYLLIVGLAFVTYLLYPWLYVHLR